MKGEIALPYSFEHERFYYMTKLINVATSWDFKMFVLLHLCIISILYQSQLYFETIDIAKPY